ncbi:MAG: argininosuccinate synthase [Anaerolineales bacterium]|nr:argininosuccinate synthase [Anaerolineales bacterium]
MSKTEIKKVVLAYSGGLDTSVIVPWLRENYGCDVVCFTANIGQGEGEFEELEEKALASGATKLVVEDLRETFARDYLFPMLKSGALYEGQYLLGTAIARPLIAQRQVAVAEQENADALAHGCTGKGNDQVRFELTFKALNPGLHVIAPWREWEIQSREDALEYAKAHNIPVVDVPRFGFSRDRNMWHLSHEGGILENPANPPDENVYMWTASPLEAPDEVEEVEISFQSGNPVAVNGRDYTPVEIIETLNSIGARHGIGRVDMVENRLVGVKSRGIYETPGGTILRAAHAELESICLDRDTLHYKQQVALRYAELIYYGKWFTPLRESLQSFIEETQSTMTGWVRLVLYKGNVIVQGRYSPHSLYRADFATFEQDDVYDQAEAKGFISLFGLQMKVRALMKAAQQGVAPAEEMDYAQIQRD